MRPQSKENRIEGRVAVEAIESFVAQNIDEIAAFSQRRLESTICELLKIYNPAETSLGVE